MRRRRVHHWSEISKVGLSRGLVRNSSSAQRWRQSRSYLSFWGDRTDSIHWNGRSRPNPPHGMSSGWWGYPSMTSRGCARIHWHIGCQEELKPSVYETPRPMQASSLALGSANYLLAARPSTDATFSSRAQENPQTNHRTCFFSYFCMFALLQFTVVPNSLPT